VHCLRAQRSYNIGHHSKHELNDSLQYGRNPVIIVSSAADAASVIENHSARCVTDLDMTLPSDNITDVTGTTASGQADFVNRRKSSSATTSTDMATNCHWSRDDSMAHQGSLVDVEVDGSQSGASNSNPLSNHPKVNDVHLATEVPVPSPSSIPSSPPLSQPQPRPINEVRGHHP